jgi:hypothetical protein
MQLMGNGACTIAEDDLDRASATCILSCNLYCFKQNAGHLCFPTCWLCMDYASRMSVALLYVFGLPNSSAICKPGPVKVAHFVRAGFMLDDPPPPHPLALLPSLSLCLTNNLSLLPLFLSAQPCTQASGAGDGQPGSSGLRQPSLSWPASEPVVGVPSNTPLVVHPDGDHAPAMFAGVGCECKASGPFQCFVDVQ